MDEQLYTLAGGELSIWVDKSGAVMLKLTAANEDPVELGEGELLELIQILTNLHSHLRE